MAGVVRVRDVESSATTTSTSSTSAARGSASSTRNNRDDNPYADLPPPLPRYHPMAFLPRALWMVSSSYILHLMGVYETVTKSPQVKHEWFKVGLATSTLLLFLKAYMELYVGKLHNKQINYKTMPQTTHAAIVLLLVSTLSFQVALWPVYGVGKSIVVMIMVTAFLINFCLIFPTIWQNLIALVLLTFFLQEYQ